MELEELLDTELQHFGVKGMKWGVRKSRTSKDRASETTPKPKSTLRKYVDSNRRELGMNKMLKDVDTLPDSEVVRRVNRVRNENDFRRAIDNTAFVITKEGNNFVRNISIEKTCLTLNFRKESGDSISKTT